MGLGVRIQVGIDKVYSSHYKNMLHSKFPLLFTVIQLIIIGRGLGQSQAEPSRSQQLWPGSGFCQAKAPKSQAKAPRARPSQALHNPSSGLSSPLAKEIFLAHMLSAIEKNVIPYKGSDLLH